MPRAEKEAKVKQIAEELKGSQAAVLTGYRGLTVEDANELRGALGEVGARFAVLKNSLAKLAVKDAGLEELVSMFDGPTAIAFVHEDAIPAAKRLVEQARKFPVIEIRGGFAEGRILTAEQIKSLAALESREVILARIAGLGKLHMSRAAFMFKALQTRFLMTMMALAEKLPAEEVAAPADDVQEAPAAKTEVAAEEPAPAEEAPEETTEAPEETTEEEGGS